MTTESIQQVELERTPGETKFLLYLRNLGLRKENLNGKCILDAGAGGREFQKFCLMSGIQGEVYSLDIQGFESVQQNTDLSEQIDSRSVVADFKATPFQSNFFDQVLCNFNMPGRHELCIKCDLVEMRNSIRTTLIELLRITKCGGEIRMFPVFIEFSPDPEKSLYFIDNIDEIRKQVKEARETKNVEAMFDLSEVIPDILWAQTFLEELSLLEDTGVVNVNLEVVELNHHHTNLRVVIKNLT